MQEKHKQNSDTSAHVLISVFPILSEAEKSIHGARLQRNEPHLFGHILRFCTRGDQHVPRSRHSGNQFRQAGKKEPPPFDPDPEVAVVKYLAANSYEGEDVQLVLAAMREGNATDAAAVRLVQTMAENWAEAKDIAGVLRNRRTRTESKGTAAAGDVGAIAPAMVR